MFPVTSFKFLFVLFNYFKNYLISFFFQIDLETHILESNLNFYSYGDISRDSVRMCVCLCVAVLKMVKVSHFFCYRKILLKTVEVLFLCFCIFSYMSLKFYVSKSVSERFLHSASGIKFNFNLYLQKISFHSNHEERQYQRMLKLPHNCTHFTR